MSTPSPFETGKAVGGNILGGFAKARESRTLDDALTRAAQSENPQAIDEIIAQVVTRVSEPNQKAALSILQNKKNELINKKNQTEQARLAETIKGIDPESKLYQMVGEIYKANIPIDQKEKLIKNITQVFPYRAEQQERLRLDSTLKRYNSRIKELENQIKNARYMDRKPLEKQRDDLIKERDGLLNFQALSNEPKEKFDPQNPEHRAEAEELFKVEKDKGRVKEILEEKYEF